MSAIIDAHTDVETNHLLDRCTRLSTKLARALCCRRYATCFRCDSEFARKFNQMASRDIRRDKNTGVQRRKAPGFQHVYFLGWLTVLRGQWFSQSAAGKQYSERRPRTVSTRVGWGRRQTPLSSCRRRAELGMLILTAQVLAEHSALGKIAVAAIRQQRLDQVNWCAKVGKGLCSQR